MSHVEDRLGALGIPLSIVDLELLEGTASLTRQSTITVVCGCGDRKSLKIASVVRTIQRVGAYRCLSCGMKSKHEDPEYRRNHSAGIRSSWTEERLADRSRLSKEMWKDPSFAEKVTSSSREAWSDPALRRTASKMAVEKWEDPDFRLSQAKSWEDGRRREADSAMVKSLWDDPDYRGRQEAAKADPAHVALQSELAKRRWEDPDYRSMVTASMVELWEDEGLRKELSERVKSWWQDPAYVEKQRIANLDPDYLRLKSENAKRQWQNPEFRADFSEKMSAIWADPEYRKRASEIAKLQWKDESYRTTQARARANIMLSGKDSILERTTQALLDALGIPYVRHHVIGYFEFDLFVPSHGLLVECNGEYWHSLRPARDAAKFTYVNEYFPQYRVLYLWERDFLNPGLIRQKLASELFGEDSPLPQEDFSLSDVVLSPVPRERVPGSYHSLPEEFLHSFHYAGYGRSAKAVYGAFLRGELIGVCKFATPVRQEVATSMGFPQSRVLELDRLCIHPRYRKKNFASWMVSRASRAAFSDHPSVEALVSFADMTYGHVGTVYLASNWRRVHVVPPDYHYVSPDGFVIHKKTLYDHARRNSMAEREYADKNGYARVLGREKVKFFLPRDSRLSILTPA